MFENWKPERANAKRDRLIFLGARWAGRHKLALALFLVVDLVLLAWWLGLA